MGSQMGAQVGTSALSMAGGYIGGMVGGPFGSMIGSLAGGIIGSLIFGRAKAKPLVPDVQILNSSYGKPIPIVWGTMRLPVNMIWQGPISTHEHTVGKAFGTIAYNYNQSVALAVCEGPVTFKKLYLDGKLFMDWTALFPEDQCKYRFTIRTYPGDEAQLPDPKMVKWVQENVIPGASCPAYRGLAYMLYDEADMSHFGNRMPQSTVIVSTTAESYTAWKILGPWEYGNATGILPSSAPAGDEAKSTFAGEPLNAGRIKGEPLIGSPGLFGEPVNRARLTGN